MRTEHKQYSFMHFGLVIVKKRERSSAGEKKEEGDVSRAEDSEVSGKVVHSTLPVSACLPELHSPAAPQEEEQEGEKKR